MYKFLFLCTIVAAVNAGYLAPPAAVTYSAAPAVSHISYASPVVSYGTPAITTQQSNILRSPGNLAQISTYSKTIDTPFSSVSKSDVRVSNPGLAVAAAPALAYAAPAIHAAPAVTYAAAAPILAKTYAAPAIAAPVVAKTYAAPALAYAAPAPVLTKTIAAPALTYAAAPAIAKTYTANIGLLGSAYSAAPLVSHMTYSNGLGLAYSY